MSYKILITGGAGYIGTTLIPKLLNENHKVTVLDCLLHNADALIPFFRHNNFSFIKGDIRDENIIKEIISDFDIIIHLAAIVGYPACRSNPELAYSTNVTGTKIISKYLSKNQIIFFGSTGSNYGIVQDICTEDTPLQPLSLYGTSKTEAENILLNNNECIAYRFATAFGISPRLRLDLLINDFAFKAVKQGYVVVYEKHFRRTFIHVEDIANSFLFGLNNLQQMKSNVYNIGSNNMNYTKEQICELIKLNTNAYIHYAEIGEDNDKRDYIVSYDKINKLGFDTKISIEDGLKEMIDCFKVIELKNNYSNA